MILYVNLKALLTSLEESFFANKMSNHKDQKVEKVVKVVKVVKEENNRNRSKNKNNNNNQNRRNKERRNLHIGQWSPLKTPNLT